MISVCGLNCKACDIYMVSTDEKAANRVTKWFKEMGWLDKDEGISELRESAPYCLGCRDDSEIHWSPDCWILECCFHEKGLKYCSECKQFPCDKLISRSEKSQRYSRALQRLKEM